MRQCAIRAVLLAGPLAVLLVLARSADCDERSLPGSLPRPLPGHSHYGAVFDRGPRHSASLMGGTGNIHFPVSSQDPLVQKFVEQGIGQLHGFWFVEAERSFRQAARIDPNCGIAYWGMSLANQELSPARARQFVALAAKHTAGLSERERMYIDAIGNDQGYRAVIAKFPDDLEAKAFEVWRLWHKREAGDASKPLLDAADELMRQILRVEPLHPIHHAVIHFADAADTVSRALGSAARCGEAAPAIGHMWHMPAHVYFPLKRYPEAAWQLEASVRTENARAMHDRTRPSHLYAHNGEWLIRLLLFLGRVHDARRIAENMIDLPRDPLVDAVETSAQITTHASSPGNSQPEKPTETAGTSAAYGRERLIQALREYEYWDDLIALCASGYLEPSVLPAEQATFHSDLAIAHYCRGAIAAGDRERAAVRELLDEQLAARIDAPAEESGSTATIAQITRQAGNVDDFRRLATHFYLNRTALIWSLAVLAVLEAAVVWLLRRRLVRALLTVPVALLAGVWLFQQHLALLNLQYDTGEVDAAFVCRTLLRAGDFAEAEWSAQTFVTQHPRQVRPQANLVEVLYKAGKQDDARAAFNTLRSLAGTADLDSPPLARLAPIAREFGFPTDWRLPQKIQKTLAGRTSASSVESRSLASLGPLLWRPNSATTWTLPDAEGRAHSLTEFHGKPVVLLFFLGEGCLHCRAQLAAFAKQARQFSDAGLTVIAVSSDDPAGIKKLLVDDKPGLFPFLMLADPKLKVFQAYGAYDDFEQVALHGTFLVDAEGYLRWNDVSFEPFMDADFVLRESQRLLSRPLAAAEK